jgi:hypothetical protein
MNTLHPIYSDLARLEIEHRLRAVAAQRRVRLVRHGIGIARRQGHVLGQPGGGGWR